MQLAIANHGPTISQFGAFVNWKNWFFTALFSGIHFRQKTGTFCKGRRSRWICTDLIPIRVAQQAKEVEEDVDEVQIELEGGVNGVAVRQLGA